MKKNELVEIIRTLIKEELNNSLPQYLTEVLAQRLLEGTQPQPAPIREVRSPVVHAQPQRPTSQPRRSPHVVLESPLKQQPMKTFSTDPVLNKVLNETIGGIPQDAAAGIELGAIDENALTPEQQDVAAGLMNIDYKSILKASRRGNGPL